MVLALAWLAPAQSAKAFPHAAAERYLAASGPAIPSLAPQPPPPAPATLRAAEAQLRHLAASPTASRTRALAAMVLGAGEDRRGDAAGAERDLHLAASWLPLRDAATAALIGVLQRNHDDPGVLAAAAAFPVPASDPFFPAIASAAMDAAVATQQWPAVLQWSHDLPRRPAVIWAVAQAELAGGKTREAALLHQELLFRYPASPAAHEARPLWAADLAAWPELAPGWELTAEQAAAWTAAGNPQQAAASWHQAAAMAPTADQARFTASEARATLAAGNVDAAAALALSLADGSERAQALELEVEVARRQNPEALQPPLEALAAEFPASPWYARALHEAGDEALIEGDAASVQQRFDALRVHFPHSGYAEGATWLAAWAAYRLQQADTPRRLEQYLAAFPKGQEAVDALYWRGAWAADHGQPRLAQSCFHTAARRFPGTYFGQEAQRRIIASVKPAALPAWLRGWQADPPTPVASPLPAAALPAIQRARWLQDAGLTPAAATILSDAMRQQAPGAASLALARRLAALDATQGAWHDGLQAMIRALPNYLELRPSQLPPGDWKLLFPEAYRSEVSAVAAHNQLSRELLLGVVRQESSFDPGSVSSARARGLMQVELATGRGLMHRLPVAWQSLAGGEPLNPQSLLNPSLNLALGAAELRRLMNDLHDPALALAGYNAGESRARKWQQEYSGLGDDAFIESIPFGQTREYVQGVLRNAAHYRQLYGR